VERAKWIPNSVGPDSMRAAALLLSTDATLIQAVQRVFDSIDNLELRVVPRLEDLEDALHEPRVALALFHCLDDGDLPLVEQLLDLIRASQRPIATVVLGDEYRAEHALTVLRKGAADYLGRPLDLGRLGYVADVLTVRARYARPEPSEKATVEAVRL